MDDRHFDGLTRALVPPGSRRRALAALAALPLLGGVLGGLDVDIAEGKRRKRRKKRRKRKMSCKPEAATQTCAGKCGSVTNNCRQVVDCGSCACSPACGECFTCQEKTGASGVCVPRASGTPCGADTCVNGTVTAQGTCDGAGVCQPGATSSCDPYTTCDGNACATTCAGDDDCAADSYCNSGGRCVGDRSNGEVCNRGGQCTSGFCSGDLCCDSACDGLCAACDVPGHEGTCWPFPNGTPCGAGHECINGGCFRITSDGCSGCGAGCGCGGSINGTGNYLCANYVSNGCFNNAPCPLGQACASGILCLASC